MWYVYPTPPFIVNGVERGSWTNQRYALRSDQQAIAYLEFESDGVNLRNNYVEITTAVRDQLISGNTSGHLFGCVDKPKFLSSIKYFEKISKSVGDLELNNLCLEVINLTTKEEERKPNNSKRVEDVLKNTKLEMVLDNKSNDDSDSSSSNNDSNNELGEEKKTGKLDENEKEKENDLKELEKGGAQEGEITLANSIQKEKESGKEGEKENNDCEKKEEKEKEDTEDGNEGSSC
jgi:uncharacterized protein (DUF1810 family)